MDFLRLLQDNAAEISVGPSSLRNQGAKGVLAATRLFFKEIDLAAVGTLGSREWSEWLDRETDRLRLSFPRGAQKSWGGARKALNLFVRTCLYNSYLSKAYGLQRIEPFLEIPLDKDVALGLAREAAKRGHELRRFQTIKGLLKADSEAYQAFATKLARELGLRRVHLDLVFWRRENGK
jgi:hypothetical protein